jgi:AraC-like DNA-binding protein
MNYKIETLLAFLNDNLHLELSVEEMSLKVGLSPSHFQHLFKEEIN